MLVENDQPDYEGAGKFTPFDIWEKGGLTEHLGRRDLIIDAENHPSQLTIITSADSSLGVNFVLGLVGRTHRG